MDSPSWSRRGFLAAPSLLAAAPSQKAAAQPDAPRLFRTQFDANLLRKCESGGAQAVSNGGRQVAFSPDGSVLTTLAWAGPRPRVCVWRDRELAVERTLSHPPSPPLLLESPQGPPALLFSAGGGIYLADPFDAPPAPLSGVRGTLLDAAVAPGGSRVLAIASGGSLLLYWPDRAVEAEITAGDAGRASLDFDDRGNLHIAHERLEGIQYSRAGANRKLVHSELLVRPYAFHPVLLWTAGRLILAWRGESNRLPSQSKGSEAWERLGRGGYIAAMVSSGSGWTTLPIADSKQVVKPFAPIDSAYSGGLNRELRVFYEEFSPPSLGVGPDGVPAILWADTTRRWIYGVRVLGESVTGASEIRGPLEQLTGPCLVPRHTPPGIPNPPLVMVSRARSYLERLALPEPETRSGRNIDFVQADELADLRGLEFELNEMRRRPENPVIPVDPPGGVYDGSLVSNIVPDGGGWRADLMYQTRKNVDPTKNETKTQGGRAVSADGVHWTKLPPQPLRLKHSVDGVTDHKYAIRFVEDTSEPDRQKRFKGLWRSTSHEPWGWLAVTSPDGERWSVVGGNPVVVRADDDLTVKIDPDDVPGRRFKANAISRSFCGRIAAQWTSADGMHWNDERETLDFDDPFRAKPDRGSTGRILLDSWSGPDDEDEIHGGYVFRDGQRWLLHYMKWTGDGHIYCALAASRDGVNFSRVASGKATLPLGAPGSWDAARIALRESPFQVGSMWRQYYNGAGWKHGLAGQGNKTSQIGLNAPQQTGLAEIPVGRWVHVQVKREAAAGELTTVPLVLAGPHKLRVDAGGLDASCSSLSCAVLDAVSGAAVPGYGFHEFDRLPDSGRASWKGRGLETLGAARIRLRVRLEGHRTRLYGLRLDV